MLSESERPDLSAVSDDVLAYIEALEQALLQAQVGKPADHTAQVGKPADRAPILEPSERPTTIQVITISSDGVGKRTPRHLYGRQRRSGMGVFDIDLPETDTPAHLAIADLEDQLLLITNQGRAFRLAVSSIVEAIVRDRGQSFTDKLPFRPGEGIAAVLPADLGEKVALVSRKGWVRPVHGARLGSRLIPGMSFFDTGKHGPVVSATWTSGQDHLFIATRQGKAIRFAERLVHERGNLGIRLDPGDAVQAMTAVPADGGVFLLSEDGKGTVRLMSGFRAHKAPGAGGKVAMKTSGLVAALSVTPDDDLFLISQESKIIRFQAAEIPFKTGVVQGVNCMTLRADRVVAAATAPKPAEPAN